MSIQGKIRMRLQEPLILETTRPTPGPTPSTPEAREKLLTALEELQAEVNPEATRITVNENLPPDLSVKERKELWHKGKASINQYAQAGPSGDHYRVDINPNTDIANFAHELGHIKSQSEEGLARDFASLRSQIRKSPELVKAIKKASEIAPFAAGVLLPGYGDILASLALGIAPGAAVLGDEAFASINGLKIMNKAGTPANFGQKSRLAGALLSYAGNGLLYGLSGNIAGNLTEAGARAGADALFDAEDS